MLEYFARTYFKFVGCQWFATSGPNQLIADCCLLPVAFKSYFTFYQLVDSTDLRLAESTLEFGTYLSAYA